MTDFPIIRAAIEGRRAAGFDTVLANADAFAAEGVLIKAEFEDIKGVFSRCLSDAWEVVRKRHFFIDHALRSKEVEDLFWSFSIPYPHVMPGFLKKTLAAKNIPANVREDLVALFNEGIALNDKLVALKPLIGKRAPKKTKVEIEREGKERTCQICGRGILAEGGIIAHHGYTRPYEGWQTASCSGAREVPFELSRDELGKEIAALKAWRVRKVNERAAIEAETVKLILKYQVSEQDPRKAQGFKLTVDRQIEVTRDTFEALKVSTPEAFSGKYNPRKEGKYTYEALTFDGLKEQALGMVDIEIGRLDNDILRQQARYDAWSQKAIFAKGRYWFIGDEVKTADGAVGSIKGFYQHYPPQPGDVAGGVRLGAETSGFVSWNVESLEPVA
ncbi:hypothetical protein D869_gp195 [Caulobacter phage CcrRogue]|uniref:Uncharacterized protein n=1 Tax=Caulobacter phage CcrRogue TaxID=2927986 RepID=K4JNB9_9CAUD|nr:hypothetical protein D869_gp195 [Caulobacter phage CcrRogue]AFU86719.1 hypothetical protein CcrRogue_gp237 [Caulobacter phage CcrRogue]